MHTHNILLSKNQLIDELFIKNPIDNISKYDIPHVLKFFDKDGYELTTLEQDFYQKEQIQLGGHLYHTCCQLDWYIQPSTTKGIILDHSMLLHRFGFAGSALDQLTQVAIKFPLINKLISIQPKWGIDISIDWIDIAACVEVVHYEFDSRNFSQVYEQKNQIEQLFNVIDWEDAARTLLTHQSTWEGLEGIEQTNWKARFFGLPRSESLQKTW